MRHDQIFPAEGAYRWAMLDPPLSEELRLRIQAGCRDTEVGDALPSIPFPNCRLFKGTEDTQFKPVFGSLQPGKEKERVGGPDER